MPETIVNERSAQKAGRRSPKRGEKYQPVCEPGSTGQTDTAVIADSIFTLKLEPIKGIEAFVTLSGYESDDEEIDFEAEMMYEHLWAAFARFSYLIRKEKRVDPLKLGMSLKTSFRFMFSEMDKLLPSGYQYNIEIMKTKAEHARFYFKLYHDCGWEYQWHILEIGTVLPKLKKENRRLHDLFLSFIKVFAKITRIDFWNCGFMGASMDMMEESKYNIESYDDEEQVKLLNNYELYTSGLAHQYLTHIHKSPLMEPEELQKRAKRFKTGNQIANVIYQGCEILKGRYSIYDYRYYPDPEEEYDCWLDLDSQCNIIWDEEDWLAYEHREYLDMTANNGFVQSPVWSIDITEKLKDFDFLKYKNAIRWPLQLAEYMMRANNLIHQYNKAG